MNLVVSMIVLATAVNGRLSGLHTDTALVKLPARRCIGASSYTTFARGNDLGDGRVVYPLTHHSRCLRGARPNGAVAATCHRLTAEHASYFRHHQRRKFCSALKTHLMTKLS